MDGITRAVLTLCVCRPRELTHLAFIVNFPGGVWLALGVSPLREACQSASLRAREPGCTPARKPARPQANACAYRVHSTYSYWMCFACPLRQYVVLNRPSNALRCAVLCGHEASYA
jgi:hypothetical protein